MVNRVADLPLALLLAARSDEQDELLSRIALHPSTTVLTPKPLSQTAVAELAGPERAAAIHEATGGVPFFVHAMVATDDPTPRPVVESIALRLEELPPACLKLARAIAVAGSGGTIAARLAGLDVPAAVTAAEALSKADLLAGDGFAHPLVQQAVYAGTPAVERAALHAEAARLVTGAERIAAHVLAAGPGGGVPAARALREAAAAAWARNAPESAVVYLKRAAEEQLPRGELVPLLRDLARALTATEGPGGFPVLRDALALATGSEREELVLELGRALMVQGYFSDAAAVFARGESEEAHTELATVSVLDLALVRAAGGLDTLAQQLPLGASAVGAWIEVARTPPASRGADHAEQAFPDAGPTAVAGALIALMAAGRLEPRRRVLDGGRRQRPRDRRARAPAARGRAAGAGPRPPGPDRRDRGRPARADRVGRGARRALRRLPDRAAVGDLAARRRAARARRGLRGAELGHVHRAGERLAGDLRLHVPARQPGAAAARAAPRARGAQPGPRVRAPPARVGLPEPRVRRLGLDAGDRRARHRPHRGGARRRRRAGRLGRALRRRA